MNFSKHKVKMKRSRRVSTLMKKITQLTNSLIKIQKKRKLTLSWNKKVVTRINNKTWMRYRLIKKNNNHWIVKLSDLILIASIVTIPFMKTSPMMIWILILDSLPRSIIVQETTSSMMSWRPLYKTKMKLIKSRITLMKFQLTTNKNRFRTKL